MTSKEPKRKINHLLIKYIRDRAPRELHNDDIAEAFQLTREQVRNSMRQHMKAHPEDGIIEASPYVYTCVLNPPVSAQPLTAGGGWVASSSNLEIPSVSMRRGGINANDPVIVCDFVVVKRQNDVIVLQDTDDNSLWVARKL